MLSASPLISVIIPNYNHSHYLDRRIKSILNQTYQNIEIIILDDKSTDNSLEVIAKYLDDKRIRGPFVNETNSGSPFYQWEKGIQMAQGEWTWIAESDDYADNRFLEIQLKHALENSAIASFCSLICVDDFDKIISMNKESRISGIYKPFWFSLINCTGSLIRNTSSAIFQTSIARKMSKEYMNYRASGDLLFWIEYARHGMICRCPEKLAYFRMHSDSTSSVAIQNGDASFEKSRWIEWLKAQNHISLFEYYLMVGEKILELTRFAHYDSQKRQNELIEIWSKKVRYQKLSIFLYRVCYKLFKSHYTY